MKDHYRADKMALWSKLIPELMSNGNGKVYPASSEDEDDAEGAPGIKEFKSLFCFCFLFFC